MKNKKLIITIAAWILVPSILVGGFYGVQYVRKKMKDNKAKKDYAVKDATPIVTVDETIKK